MLLFLSLKMKFQDPGTTTHVLIYVFVNVVLAAFYFVCGVR